MNYKSLNKDLFRRWRDHNSEYNNFIVSDGIIDESQFEKILFITKEPNDPKPSESWDLALFLKKNLYGNYGARLSEWSYGILKGFPPIGEMPKKHHNYLRKTAVINIKKSGGKASANHSILEKHLRLNAPLLREQIMLIKPEIIIGGIGRVDYWGILFPDGWNRTRTGYDIDVGKWNGIKIIDFYHPAYRIPRVMSYVLLEKVMNSKEFKDL